MGTLIVGLIVAGCAALAIRSLVSNKKSGKASCGGDCSHCGGRCH